MSEESSETQRRALTVPRATYLGPSAASPALSLRGAEGEGAMCNMFPKGSGEDA